MLHSATLENVCDYIVLIGAAYFTIVKLYNSFSKTGSSFWKKRRVKEKEYLIDVIEEVLAPRIDEEEGKFRQEYRASVKEMMCNFDSKLDEIKELNASQSETLEKLDERLEEIGRASKDMLRQRIELIYMENKKDKSLTVQEKEILDELFKDYTALHGNGRIKKIYNRMLLWTITDDIDEDEEI